MLAFKRMALDLLIEMRAKEDEFRRIESDWQARDRALDALDAANRELGLPPSKEKRWSKARRQAQPSLECSLIGAKYRGSPDLMWIHMVSDYLHDDEIAELLKDAGRYAAGREAEMRNVAERRRDVAGRVERTRELEEWIRSLLSAPRSMSS